MSISFRNEIKTKGQLKKLVFSAATTNHIWVNAFTLVRPSDETYIGIGKAVVEMLKNRDNLLPSYTAGAAKDAVHEISRLTPCLYMHINAS